MSSTLSLRKLGINILIILVILTIGIFTIFLIRKEKGPKIYSEPNLVGYWKFDEGKDCEVFDSSGNNNQAILKPNCPENSPQRVLIEGKDNFAFQFDGKDDYLEIPESAILDITKKITVQASIKYSTDPKSFNGIILAKYDKDFELPYYLFSGPVVNGISFAVRDNFGLEHSATFSLDNLKDWQNTWFKIVGTFDGEKLRIFVNGAEGESAELEFKSEIKNKNQGIRIGSRNSEDLAFKGLIDEVKIYNIAISQ